MTPTNKTRLSVLMAYHTQQIEAWDNRSPEFKHHFGKFCGWDIAGIEIDCGGYICETTFNEFTIPLRSVEQMTDEEYVEVARITGVTSAKGYRSPCGGEVTLRTIGWEVLNRSKHHSHDIAHYPGADTCHKSHTSTSNTSA